MAAEKNVSISFRAPEFKSLIGRAAAHEQCSQMNLLEKPLFGHCRLRWITVTQHAALQLEKAGAQ